MADETKSEQIMTRVTPATREALERISKELDRSVSWILNDLAVKFIESRQGPKKRK
jgi:hypothetical protein